MPDSSQATLLDFDGVCRALEAHGQEPVQLRLAFLRLEGESGPNPMPFEEVSGLLSLLTQDEVPAIGDLPAGVIEPGQRDCAFRVGRTLFGFTSADFTQGGLDAPLLTVQIGAVAFSFNFDIADFREREVPNA